MGKIIEMLKTISQEDISFSKHAAHMLKEREISRKFLLEKLFDLDSLIAEIKQNETYKLIYKISKKYKLVVVVNAKNGKLKIVTVFKTSKKTEKLLKRARGIIMYIKTSEIG